MCRVHCIPILDDNYVWVVEIGNLAWVVDPGDHTPVITFLKRHNLNLGGILITHHHFDHTSGVQPLVDHFSHSITPVYGVLGTFRPNVTLIATAPAS